MLLITNQPFGLVGFVRLPLRLRILSRELSGHLLFLLKLFQCSLSFSLATYSLTYPTRHIIPRHNLLLLRILFIPLSYIPFTGDAPR